jgi:hypothetical protein
VPHTSFTDFARSSRYYLWSCTLHHLFLSHVEVLPATPFAVSLVNFSC